jgi:iron complex outermembrane receptor protein
MKKTGKRVCETLKGKFLLAGVVAAIFAVTMVLNLFLAPSAAAQEEKSKQETAQEEKAPEEYGLETMTVTVQKREEDIQDVPASVTALSDIQIEDAGIESTNEIHTLVPNFSAFDYVGTGFSFYSIRGLSNYTGQTAPVGIYIDDVPMITKYLTDSKIFEIERIEVLRGPQGNLYGLNSEAGIVNIITKKPGNIWTGAATVGFGDYETQSYKASVSGPVIKDKLFFGLSGMYDKQGEGYINAGGDHPDTREIGAGRGQIRWTPNHDLDMTFSVTEETRDDGMPRFVLVDDDPFDIPDKNIDETSDVDADTQSLRIKYRAPWFELTSVSARYSNDLDQIMSIDCSGMNLLSMTCYNDETTYSQEIRLNSIDSDSAFQWLAGGYYFSGELIYDTTAIYDAAMLDPTGMTPPGLMTIEDPTYTTLDTDTYAIFGQTGYTFFDKLTLTAGLRYDRDKKETDYYHQGFTIFGMPPTSYKDSDTWEAWSPKFIADYRWTPSVLTYVSAAKGYRAGGYAPYGADTAENAKFDPEYAWSYEAGLKTNWLDNRIMINAAAFYTKVKDFQIYRLNELLQPTYTNAPKVTLQGFEAELLARPLKGMDIMASFGYLDTEFDEYKDPFNPAGPKDYKGNKIPLSPEYTASLAAQYRLPCGLFARVEGNWLGDTYFDEANTNKQDAYLITNGKIGYETEYFDIYGFVNNISDKEYYTIIMDFPGQKIGAIGDPRTFGVQATVRF